MADIKKIVANNICALRQDKELTQLELAQKLNYSDKAVSKWERGESLPDLSVLIEIANLFGVTLDYLVSEEHESKSLSATMGRQTKNRGFITGMAIILVWLVAALIFLILDSIPTKLPNYWLTFIYAVPVTMIVWLIFNSIWFKKQRNFLIISFLMWSILLSMFITLLLLGHNIWKLFIPGIAGQFIIIMWSRIKLKSQKY